MSSITPFTIAIPDDKIKRLKQKLVLTDFPDELIDVEPWSRGSPLSDIKRLTLYWQSGFDWRKVEAKLNQLPQYIAKIEVDGFDTYDVHFVHQPSTVKDAIPLLFIHGWPGSFIEVTKVLPELIKGGEDFPAFHVVAPSLIDFGFSSASRKNGFNIDQHAETCHKLMLALGYNEYVVQGGDLGYIIARFLALNYGTEHVKAHHVNTVAPAEPSATAHPVLYAKAQTTPLSDTEKAGLGRSEWFSKEGNGYYRKQATKPQTVGYFMTDSPVGLLAWIYEKLHDWTDHYDWADEEILTWISIYYFSKAGPAATSFIYYEIEHRDPQVFAAAQVYSEVPLGISRFPRDLILLPKLWNHTLGPIVYEKEHERGGHFGAWERPDAIVEDLRTMFGKHGGAYNVVKGKSGFL
ncbi:alpha/beta-hydrolase [Glonium stellatum]|uniref:Alpha/beta-hydrolase n=1 Tax=Glonium stellatum TaxID=574774 RepID=A0A8E2ET40_9PEZI|nr:alpha/beta-hydrolase [Glonium stellatum]